MTRFARVPIQAAHLKLTVTVFALVVAGVSGVRNFFARRATR